MASSLKTCQSRRRVSCDGCFLAKVKCSKARPICSRCLTYGVECRYLPMGRSENYRSDNTSNGNISAPGRTGLSSMSDKNFAHPISEAPSPGVCELGAGWDRHTSVNGEISRNHSASSEPTCLQVEEGSNSVSAERGAYSMSMSWNPSTDASSAFLGVPLLQPYDSNLHAAVTETDPSLPHICTHGQSQMPFSTCSHFPNRSATPKLRPVPLVSESLSPNPAGNVGSCACFTVCFQSLQSLQIATTPATVPFDGVLSLNRTALEGCTTMLACTRCLEGSGTYAAAMLFSALIGKIILLYRDSSQSYFENAIGTSPRASARLRVSWGAYHVNTEDSLHIGLEILSYELRKLGEVYARFREVCAGLFEDLEVSRAITEYLDKILASAVETVTNWKRNMGL